MVLMDCCGLIQIKDINEINEKEGYFTSKMVLKRTWFDQRVTFQNLKNDTELNIIVPDDGDLLWKPWTTFYNIKDRSSYAITDTDPEWRVIPNPKNKFVLADKSFLRNTYLFDGASNMINYETALTVEWILTSIWNGIRLTHRFVKWNFYQKTTLFIQSLKK